MRNEKGRDGVRWRGPNRAVPIRIFLRARAFIPALPCSIPSYPIPSHHSPSRPAHRILPHPPHTIPAHLPPHSAQSHLSLPHSASSQLIPAPSRPLTSPPNPSHPISFYSITSHTIQPHQLPSCPISLRPFPSRSIPHHLRLSPTCLSALTTMNNAAFQRVLQVKSTGCPPYLPVMFMSLNAVPFIPGHRSWCRYNQSV